MTLCALLVLLAGWVWLWRRLAALERAYRRMSMAGCGPGRRGSGGVMPIKPENRGRYPKDWREIRERILQRARNRCEECGAFNHDWGWRDPSGDFHRVNKRVLCDAGYQPPPFYLSMHNDEWSVRTERIIEIVLTIAHLDHMPENCADANLKALCQRCHLRYDAQRHAETRRLSLEREAGQQRLAV